MTDNAQPTTEAATRKVRVSPEVMDRWWTRDDLGNRLSVEWGEPDEDGFYEPAITVHYDDNIVERARAESAAKVRAAIEGRLEHGLRHVPGATPREERYYNDGQAFGLRWALDAALAALDADAPAETVWVGFDLAAPGDGPHAHPSLCAGCGHPRVCHGPNGECPRYRGEQG